MSTGFEKYQFGGWTDPRVIYNSAPKVETRYGTEYKQKAKWGSPLMPNKKVDAHKYETEAKDLPIEACVSMWVIKYGDGQVPAIETTEQGKLMWEIGNRLWWANRMNYNQSTDTYEIID
jgi:hypothetical protein